MQIYMVGQNHTFIGTHGVHTVFLAGKSPYIRSYTVQIYGSGQPYRYTTASHCTLQVKVAMAYLRLIASPTTDSVALEKIINNPSRGIGWWLGLLLSPMTCFQLPKMPCYALQLPMATVRQYGWWCCMVPKTLLFLGCFE